MWFLRNIRLFNIWIKNFGWTAGVQVISKELKKRFNFRITNMNFAGAHVIPKEHKHKKNLNFRLITSAGVHVVPKEVPKEQKKNLNPE